ncbi:PAAR domain-containing protein [Escherichia coli]|uniref:PAAR domain-containing protein n=1 Tax=Escherichia TaxID=561 RepID=UPI000B90ECD9|nr:MULTISPECIES: PAAR domain-containing protein [Escherichia]MBB2340805.1 PAAR domain-containing protein [Escherichia sp. 93.0750]EFB2838772.1 PAAR domain-containing protein [Escherichia coli]EFC0649826.1 PAAR domain-containing protein [Escherichia coli]EHS3896908.1 PAAR domain-containing protein [Escherichia coli]EHS4055141.1 PAAR domain-containing protein [Escherichia coli]
MANGLVLLGDKTTHGGKVNSASSNITVDGKKVALVGDFVCCPIIGHGTNPIVEGSPHRTFNGRAVVVDGCQCLCGCKVISSAKNSTVGQ